MSKPQNLGELKEAYEDSLTVDPELWEAIRVLLQTKIENIQVAKGVEKNKRHRLAFGYAILELKDFGEGVL